MSKWMLALVFCLGLGLILTLAPTERAEGAGKPRSRRLVKPWSELTSLTEEQKTQIIDLHQQALEDRKAIDRREREQILSLLTEAQQIELRDLEQKKAADRKAKEAAKRADDDAAQ